MNKTNNIETVQRIDFDRLDSLVSERIGALRRVAQSLNKTGGGAQEQDMICRDLILPCVHLLAQFIECVTVDQGEQSPAGDEPSDGGRR